MKLTKRVEVFEQEVALAEKRLATAQAIIARLMTYRNEQATAKGNGYEYWEPTAEWQGAMGTARRAVAAAERQLQRRRAALKVANGQSVGKPIRYWNKLYEWAAADIAATQVSAESACIAAEIVVEQTAQAARPGHNEWSMEGGCGHWKWVEDPPAIADSSKSEEAPLPPQESLAGIPQG